MENIDPAFCSTNSQIISELYAVLLAKETVTKLYIYQVLLINSALISLCGPLKKKYLSILGYYMKNRIWIPSINMARYSILKQKPSVKFDGNPLYKADFFF